MAQGKSLITPKFVTTILDFRGFIAAELRGGKSSVDALVTSIDECVADFDQPVFYEVCKYIIGYFPRKEKEENLFSRDRRSRGNG